MTTFPLCHLSRLLLGHWGAYIVYLLIGFAFGYVLEIAGFGNSTQAGGPVLLQRHDRAQGDVQRHRRGHGADLLRPPALGCWTTT